MNNQKRRVFARHGTMLFIRAKLASARRDATCKILLRGGLSDEFQGSPPCGPYNTVKFRNKGVIHEKYEEIKRKIGGEVKISTAKWLKSKRDAAKYSIFWR